MPRVLGVERHILEVKDNISGDILELHYRLMNNSDRIKYSKSTTKRSGTKIAIKANTFKDQVALGKAVLIGFKKGSFANAEGKLISSDPNDPDYAPDWKNQLEKDASDILANLGRHVLTSVASPDGEEVLVYEDFEDPTTPSSDTSADATQSAPAPSA